MAKFGSPVRPVRPFVSSVSLGMLLSMNTNSKSVALKSEEQLALRPGFVASNCESWTTRMMLCGGRAFADVVGFSRDILGYRCLPRSTDRARTTLQFYEFTFAENWVVVSPDQVDWVERQMRPWWGIIVAHSEGCCEMLRHAKISPIRKSIAIAELLWSSEVEDLLEKCCDAKPLTGRRRRREQIAEAMPPEQLGPLASIAIRSRPRWRARVA